MTFQSTPPTKPGAYWWKRSEKSFPVVVILESATEQVIDGRLYPAPTRGFWSPRLVPVDEVEKAWHEGYNTRGGPNSRTFDAEGVDVPNYLDSRARRVVEGKEEV